MFDAALIEEDLRFYVLPMIRFVRINVDVTRI